MPHDIVTLPPEEVTQFLLRHRRHGTLERYEPRLDHFLREILSKANEFVPSESGAILLDDPKVKLFGSKTTLTTIASFGADSSARLGLRIPCDEGVLGKVYTSVRSICTTEDLTGGVHSLLAVPVVVGNAVCGVLQLSNRLPSKAFSAQDRALIEIFAGYLSSSVQNAIDAIRSREAARRDHLTGLFNERYFHYRLREEIRRAKQSASELSLMFIDLDNFKQVNDRFGHLVGSRTLHEVGLTLQDDNTPRAIAARYGGDEFVVILPDIAGQQAMEIAERLRRRIASGQFIERQQREISVSIGVASLQQIPPGPDDRVIEQTNSLIKMADSAMYEAKAAGKNRVSFAAEESIGQDGNATLMENDLEWTRR